MNPYQITSVDAYNRAAEEFEAKKREQLLAEQLTQGKLSMLPFEQQKMIADAQFAARGGGLPATIQIANEIDKALKSGNTARANMLMQVHKTFDKGILPYGGQPQPAQPTAPQITPNMSPVDLTADQTAQAIPSGMIPQQPQELPIQVAQNQLPTSGVSVMPNYGKAVASIAAEKERAKASAKPLGTADAELNERVAYLPQLKDTVNRLSVLGKEATYTFSGQALDAFRREAGYEPRDKAIARTEYISMVDNEVLPLLRQTFGAQFTEREGTSLKTTLGDPNKTPAEKDAVLRSFINTKMNTIQSLQRQTGAPVSKIEDMSGGINIGVNAPPEQPMDNYSKGEAAFNARKGKATHRYNPATGRVEAIQ